MGRVGRVKSLQARFNSSLANLRAGSGIGGEGKGSLVGRNMGDMSVFETSVVSVRSKGVGAGNGRQQKSDGRKCVEQHHESVLWRCLVCYRKTRKGSCRRKSPVTKRVWGSACGSRSVSSRVGCMLLAKSSAIAELGRPPNRGRRVEMSKEEKR